MPYTIRKVRLTQDGYEMGKGRYPRYWGTGMPLYRVIDKESGDYLIEFRAPNREAAIHKAKACEEKAKQMRTTMDLVPGSRY